MRSVVLSVLLLHARIVKACAHTTKRTHLAVLEQAAQGALCGTQCAVEHVHVSLHAGVVWTLGGSHADVQPSCLGGCVSRVWYENSN